MSDFIVYVRSLPKQPADVFAPVGGGPEWAGSYWNGRPLPVRRRAAYPSNSFIPRQEPLRTWPKQAQMFAPKRVRRPPGPQPWQPTVITTPTYASTVIPQRMVPRRAAWVRSTVVEPHVTTPPNVAAWHVPRAFAPARRASVVSQSWLPAQPPSTVPFVERYGGAPVRRRPVAPRWRDDEAWIPTTPPPPGGTRREWRRAYGKWHRSSGT